MTRATYNITNDKLQVWFDDRLSPEEYASAKRCRFVWWPGRKCFAAKWNTEAEDFILARGIQIDEDDTPDDVEARVERFAARAEDASESADASADYLANRANTARRQERAAASVERSLSEAEHWNNRIAASIRHAAFKERPDVIARRIKVLEAEERKAKKNATTEEAARWLNLSAYVKKDENGADVINPETGRKVLDRDAIAAACAPEINRATRWADHVGKRLTYERALLEAAGGIIVQHAKPQKGGAVFVHQFNVNGVWCEIVRTGTAKIRVAAPGSHWVDTLQVDATRVTEMMTPEAFKEYKDAGNYCASVGDWDTANAERLELIAAQQRNHAERVAARNAAAAK